MEIITGITRHTIIKVNGQLVKEQEDILAIEEPVQLQLQINSSTGRIDKNIAVTMRTPGNDKELAAGFLFTEGIINSNDDIDHIIVPANDENRVMVILKENVQPLMQNIQRNFYTTSSCGVCGKASIDAIRTVTAFNDAIHFTVSTDVLYALQDELRKQQQLFDSTGGLHAAALFSLSGDFIMLKEDVGRHNALDKLIGAALLTNQLPLSDSILMLSGRISFELMQKAAMAGIKIIAAVGAPSSLAVELAEENGITLIGFLKKDKMNIYCGKQRIQL
jgi:FdhD protein